MDNRVKSRCLIGPRAARALLLVIAMLVTGAGMAKPGAAQTDDADQTDPLLRRWVGHHRNRPIFFDFYSDSMLVVDDIHVLGFAFTWDSIIAYGDTSFAVSYRFSYDRLLITK